MNLTPDEFQQLHAVLLGAFADATELQMLVRFNYPPEISKLVDWQRSLEEVVAQLLTRLEARGDLEPLVRGMVKARPKKDEVVAFCRAHCPEAFEERDAAVLVGRVTGGLQSLIAALKDPGVRLAIGAFQADIDTARTRIRTLAAYKVLHDSLHNLEQRLPSIRDAADKPKTDVVATLQLRRAAMDLAKEARRARENAALTPTGALELSWIDDLDQSLKELTPGVLPLSPPLIPSLQRLIQEATRINGQLCVVAGDMRLEALIRALEAIQQRLPGNGAPGGPAARVKEGLAGLKELRAEFVRRVAEHQEWQWLDRQLGAAEGSLEFDPAKKVPRWTEVRSRLGRLCDLFPAEDWYAQIRAQRDRWEAVVQGNDPVAGTIEGDTFRALASNCFFDVDGALNTLCEQLKDVSLLLDTLMGVLTND
jgi:hypothetical protein